MSEKPRKPPELTPEVGPEAPGSRWLTMPAVGGLLGLSERAARDWVKRRDLPVRGSRPVRVSEQAVLAAMAEEERVARKPPEVTPEVPGSSPEAPGTGEPIEAAYRVAPAEIERAIERTGAKYVADFAALYDRIAGEVGRLYEGQLAAKEQVIATQVEAIAELRRRAETAEVERDRLKAAQATQGGPGTVEVPPEEHQGVWPRLRRWWRG